MGNPLSELGISTDEKLTVEHAIVLQMSKSMEEALRYTLLAVTKSSKEANRTMKIIGYAVASYLVLAGVARVIEASSSSGRKGEKR